MKSGFVRWSAILIAALVAICIALLVTNSRMLIWETRIATNETVQVEDYGEVSNSLVCRYFTGRSIVTKVFYFAPNNFMGRDSCPFIDEP